MRRRYLSYLKKLVKSLLKSSKSEAKPVKTKVSLQGYTCDFNINGITDRAFETAKSIRKSERPPVIIIHGVMPRSGTVYVGNLLRLHPDIYAYPNEIWEVPFISSLNNILDFQQQFFKEYPKNTGKIGEQDFLPLFGAAFIDYLYSYVSEGKQMLIKVPSVRYLNYFPSVFPYEMLLLLIRDGRDVVSSTLKTWPYKKISDVCREWNDSAKMLLGFSEHYRNKKNDYLLVKYEDILENPVNFTKIACDRYGLDYQKFPVEKIDELKVVGSSSIQSQGKVTWQAAEKPQDFQSTQRWLKWSSEEKQIFKEIAGQTLIDAGYEKDLDW